MKQDQWPPSAIQTGYKCAKPYRYEYQAEAFQRDCGKCPRCLAAKKRDLTARAAAEATVSDEVVFITLTYRPGEAGAFEWLTSDRQAFMKRLRARLWARAETAVGAPRRRRGSVREHWQPIIAAATQRVRYVGCGEVGEKRTKRNHWHIVLFFRGGIGSSGFRSTPPDKRGDKLENIDLWPHGHVSIEALPVEPFERVRVIRYVVMYMHKKAESAVVKGVSRAACVPFRSTKPALGSHYLAQWGRDCAVAGLPLHGWFKVPGVQYSKGVRAGQPVKNYLSGVVRSEVIAAYREQWQAKHGERPLPHSDFLKRFDPEYLQPARNPARHKPLRVRRGVKLQVLPSSSFATWAEWLQHKTDCDAAGLSAVVAAFPLGVAIGPWGDPGPTPRTALRHKVRIAGLVDDSDKPVRVAVPESDWVKGSPADQADQGLAGAVRSWVVRRPPDLHSFGWPGRPPWMRQAP